MFALNKKSLNEKGFNLFTALISFLLIMLAVLLIQSMIQTERNAADTIAKIESRSKLEATAEMARADAMQVFNYALRKKIEDWLTDPERGGLTLELHNKTWEEIQDEFAASKFGGEQGSQFAKFTASSLEGLFYSTTHFGKYEIMLEGSETLESGINNAIAKSLDDFFTVIDCPDGDPRDCDKGTFYVNLHIEKLTQEEYEDLPKLHVTDWATGEELKEIILPKTTFRIYVPLRFFKAIAEARALTHFPLEAEVDSPSDQGLFSPRVHNTIEQMGLGMCDFGYCAPRTNPLDVPATLNLTGAGTFCPGDSTGGGANYQGGLPTKIECTQSWCPAGMNESTYLAGGSDNYTDMKNNLSLIAGGKVCDVLKQAKSAGYIDVDPSDKFDLVGNECEGSGVNLAYDISVNIDARDSKLVGDASGGGQGLPDPGRNLGLYRTPEGTVDFPHVGGVEFLGCSDSSSEFKSRCAEVKSVKVTLAFQENDPNYMVREAGSGEQRIYRISVYDNTYVPFTANWQQGPMNETTFLYEWEPQKTDCSMSVGAGWYCKTGSSFDDLGNPTAAGCSAPSQYREGEKKHHDD